MTFNIDPNVIRIILRINAGWMIWAGSLATQRLVAAIACESRASPVEMSVPHAWIVAMGLIAAACAIALLYRIVSDIRAHREAHDPHGELAVDYLAGAVAALSLLAIAGSTWASSTSILCIQ